MVGFLIGWGEVGDGVQLSEKWKELVPRKATITHVFTNGSVELLLNSGRKEIFHWAYIRLFNSLQLNRSELNGLLAGQKVCYHLILNEKILAWKEGDEFPINLKLIEKGWAMPDFKEKWPSPYEKSIYIRAYFRSYRLHQGIWKKMAWKRSYGGF